MAFLNPWERSGLIWLVAVAILAFAVWRLFS